MFDHDDEAPADGGVCPTLAPIDDADGREADGPPPPEEGGAAADETSGPSPAPNLSGRGKAGGPRRSGPPTADDLARAEYRMRVLDAWQRSGLTAEEFGDLVRIKKHTLFSWSQRFRREGPAGLIDHPRGAVKGTRVDEMTKRAIIMMKRSNPTWGYQRITDMLVRGPGMFASANVVARVLKEAGFEPEERPSTPHPDKPRSFERARPNQLWQTDLFTFTLKRQNRRVYLVAFMDDHSRFIVSYGLSASASTAMVIEVLLAGIASYGPPEEILTDNGPQYVTWRGKSAFSKELEKRGVHHIVATPRRPQTLGKIERFWGTLWPECVQSAIFLDLDDARRRIGLFIDHYNFQRTHQGIDGLVPADRFFDAAEEVKRTLAARVAANSLELARHGVPRKPFYLTGQVGGQTFSVHAEGERVIFKPADGGREEVQLVRPPELPEPLTELPEPVCPQANLAASGLAEGNELPPEPGVSAVDEFADGTDAGSREATTIEELLGGDRNGGDAQ